MLPDHDHRALLKAVVATRAATLEALATRSSRISDAVHLVARLCLAKLAFRAEVCRFFQLGSTNGPPRTLRRGKSVTTVEQVIDDLRARGKRLPLALAGQLFCAAVRLVVKRPVSLRPPPLVLDGPEAPLLVPPPQG